MITTRRTFLGGSCALAFAGKESLAYAADSQQCLSSYVPASLTLTCATRKNYETFRDNSERIHLAGLVSLVNFKGQYGQYNAGTLFLFPVLRPAYLQPKAKPGVKLPEIAGLLPRTATDSIVLPPLDAGHNEESLVGRLSPEAHALKRFVGFGVDVAASDGRSRLSRFTEGKLPDGKSIRIEWTVSNLNRSWFAGSPTIPQDQTCDGASWRKLIVEGLKQATSRACS